MGLRELLTIAVERKAVDPFMRLGRGKQYACNVRGMTILVDVHSKLDRLRARTYATKEPETLEWIELYFQQGDVMYDIGANIGLYGLFAAKWLRGQCKVYAFEPEALNYAQLSRNIFLNNLSGIVLPCCVAVTDRLCFDRFYLNPHNFEKMAGNQLSSGSALHSFGIAVDYNGESFQPFHQQGMVGVSLDHLWQVWGLDFPNHIKIDVDGLEEKVIVGGQQTLEDERLKSVLVEICQSKGESNPVLRRLSQAGFVHVKNFDGHSSGDVQGTLYQDCVNSLFVRKP